MPRRFAWASFSDAQLLELRLKDLGVGIKGTWLEDCVASLHRELRKKGIRIKLHTWISDEWFSPDTTPGIAIPFYLTHPRLVRLERRKIIDVEGGSEAECMRILRHEAGHVMQHAYQLHKRRRWQQLFGASSTPYPKHYRPNSRSHRFVRHLRLWYAQSHPDEDFAETFAVWLTPRSNWRKRYTSWPAIKKLEYVEELMAEIADQKPVLKKQIEVDPASRQTRTLAQHYKKKQDFYLGDSPRGYDRDLLKIFSSDPERKRSQAASTFLEKNRAQIRRRVSKSTGEYQLTLDDVLDDIIKRCRALKLRTVGSQRQLIRDFTVLLTARTVHSLYNRTRRSFAL